MPSNVTSDRPVVVLGAGPHGLAAIAHLRAAGFPTVAFGRTLSFWRDTMPKDMWLRSSPRASHISSPDGALALSTWAKERDHKVPEILTIAEFIEYGSWFQQRAVSDLDARHVSDVAQAGSHFTVTLDDGEQVAASRVVVAAGLEPFAYVPSVFDGLSPSIASHTSTIPDLERLAGKSVAVIGAGQSALESAALLHESGADVELIGRTSQIYWLGSWTDDGESGNDNGGVMPTVKRPPKETWRARTGLHWHNAPTEVGGRYSAWIGAAPDVVRHFPRSIRAPLTYHCIRPAGAYWLPDRLRAVKFSLGRSVVAASEQDGRASLRLDDGTERIVDHVVLGTGYAIDVRKYPFFGAELLSKLRLEQGSPVLRRGLESSIPGLHFVGAPAAESFGPVMRFVVGTAYTAPALTQGIKGDRTPIFRWAF